MIKSNCIRRILRSFIAATFLIGLPHIAQGNVERIEPPFWWAGMQSKNLQLMVYGNDVGSMNVTSSSSEVVITEVRAAENNNYLFVELELGEHHKPGEVELTFAAPNGDVSKHAYSFKQRRPQSRERQGFSSRDVIYLMTPDRFANGDPANDSVDSLFEKVDRNNPDGRHGGDLIGLKNSLGYLQDLGITQVWLNPLQENNQEEYSYHGYSISDLYSIDARFGGNDALLDFTAAAKQFGIGLIMDTIPNHIGLNHWWMKDLPSKDWVNNEGTFFQTSHSHEMIQDPYAPESDKREFNDGWFVPTMPDLNQRNDDLARYFIQNNIWWVEHADLTGLRVDTLPYGDKQFTARFNQALLNEYPNFNIVGEEWTTNPAMVAYWQEGQTNLDGYQGGSPSLMDFPLQNALIEGLNSSDANAGLKRIHTMLANDFQYPDASNLVVIADNHDMNRVFTWLNEDVALTKMALTFLMTTRGIPQLFYGTEILMENSGTDAHGVIRSDFPGGWPGDKVNAFTGEGLSEEQADAQKFVKTLLNWRKKTTAIHTGSLTHYLPKEGVYTYFRRDADALVMVVMNANDESKDLSTERFAETTKGVSTAIDVMTGESSAFGATLKVPAKTALLLELK